MTIQDHLDKLFKESQRIKIGKAIIIGDLHLGVRDNADDFDGHDVLFFNSIFPYIKPECSLLLGGDITDDWENPDRSKIKAQYPAVWKILELGDYQIQGNHDPDPTLPMAYILVLNSGKEVLWTHGHVGDFFNYQASWLGKFFVRHIWRNLQLTGVFKDPTTATVRNLGKHEATKLAFLDWAQTRKREVIFHHTHFATDGPSWNAGSWVGLGGQAILIDGDKIEVKNFT
jgi:DNA repair exonuclease SbcCD nuclease subunit